MKKDMTNDLKSLAVMSVIAVTIITLRLLVWFRRYDLKQSVTVFTRTQMDPLSKTHPLT